MQNYVRVMLLAVAVSTASVGCGNKAAEAQKEADQKAAEAAKAQAVADEKAATEKKEAEATALKANAETKVKLQKDVDAANRKITYLKEKVAKATGAMKKNADAAATEVDTRTATVKADMAKLDGATGTAWDTAKTQVEADTAALNKAVDALEATLKK